MESHTDTATVEAPAESDNPIDSLPQETTQDSFLDALDAALDNINNPEFVESVDQEAQEAVEKEEQRKRRRIRRTRRRRGRRRKCLRRGRRKCLKKREKGFNAWLSGWYQVQLEKVVNTVMRGHQNEKTTGLH